MNGNGDFTYSDRLATEQVAEYFTRIAQGIRMGNLTLRGKGSSLNLPTGQTVKMMLKSQTRPGKGKMEIELSWKEGAPSQMANLQVEPGIPFSFEIQPGGTQQVSLVVQEPEEPHTVPPENSLERADTQDTSGQIAVEEPAQSAIVSESPVTATSATDKKKAPAPDIENTTPRPAKTAARRRSRTNRRNK
jgi:amphi-Trp domain-containing protein